MLDVKRIGSWETHMKIYKLHKETCWGSVFFGSAKMSEITVKWKIISLGKKATQWE